MALQSHLADGLDRAGYRLTRPRRAVLDLISGRDGHFTAADLVRDVRDRNLGIGRATIFRSLEMLAELQLLEHIDLPSGDHAYVACEPAHHHHVVCSHCGDTAEVEDCGLVAVLGAMARRTGFAIESHRLEIFGLCAECQSAG
jgi:Fe2+ or Zn2+ uptake regulation protein